MFDFCRVFALFPLARQIRDYSDANVTQWLHSILPRSIPSITTRTVRRLHPLGGPITTEDTRQ